MEAVSRKRFNWRIRFSPLEKLRLFHTWRPLQSNGLYSPAVYNESNHNHSDSYLSTPEAYHRARWSSPMEFFFSCVGYAVGLGNLWRFPYLCMQNGGGAFLIPYFTSLFLCGMPFFVLELLISQYSASGCITVWNLAPIFKGIGWTMALASSMYCVYYNLIMCWVIYYLVHSFRWTLPWSECGQSWNSRRCFSYKQMIQGKYSVNYSTIVPGSSANGTGPRSSTEEFWLFNTLEISSGIDDLGGMRWQLVLCFLGSWTLVYLCLFRGIKTSGKIVYVTAVAPYIFITIILIRGVLLEGSWNGIVFYLKPKWESLLSFEIWSIAATQIFYTLGPAWGGIFTFGSYNNFYHNFLRDGLIIPLICCLTSFYGGFAIFSVLGHMAHVANATDIETVVRAGPGLAFVAYPEALSQLPGGSIWSVLFFLMLITLGLDSLFATVETALTGLVDEFPRWLSKHRSLFTLAFVVVQALLGLIFTTRAGVYYFQVIDWYMSIACTVCVALLELVALIFVFGVGNIIRCAEEMLGKLSLFTKLWWSINWCIVSPIFLIVVTVSIFSSMSEPLFDETLRYPRWAIIMGWSIAGITVLPIPLYALYLIYSTGFSRWREWFIPNADFHASVSAQIKSSQSTKGDQDIRLIGQPLEDSLSIGNHEVHSSPTFVHYTGEKILPSKTSESVLIVS